MKEKNDDLLDKSVRKEEFLYPTYPEDDSMVSAVRPVSVVNLLRERDNFLDKLVSLLVSGKTTLLVTTAICLMIGSFIYLSVPLKYESEATVISPTEDNIVVLNSYYADIGLAQLTTREIYEAFLVNLRSKQVARDFYNKFNIGQQLDNQMSNFKNVLAPVHALLENIGFDTPPDYADLFEEWFFNKMAITFPYSGNTLIEYQTAADTAVNIPDAVARSSVRVQLDGLDPELISKWINDYIQYVNDITIGQFVKAGEDQAKVVEKALAFEIESIENVAMDQKNQDIATLRQALVDAEKFGITTPVVGGGESIFLRGSQMLRRQLQSILADNPESAELNAVRLQYRKITNLFIDPNDVRAFRLDSPAKPNKAYNDPTYILIISLIIGLMFSYGIHSRFLTKQTEA